MNWSQCSDDLKKRIIKQDPKGFDSGGIRTLQTKKPEPNRLGEGQDCKLETVQGCVAYRVTLITLGGKRLDEHDNLRFSLKPLVDAITTSLGLKSDDDPSIEWCYHQVTGSGCDYRKD